MPKIVDPDNLSQKTAVDQSGSVIFLYTDPLIRRIQLASNLISGSSNIEPTISGSNTGVTMQALYSFCKEQWKADNNLIKIPFPFISITKNQFDFINNWDFAEDTSRYLIRDAGWSVRSGSANVSTQEWTGIVTLGSLAVATDQVYYTQSGSFSTRPVSFQMPGTINQAVQVYSASSEVTVYDYRNYLKTFVRTWGFTYDDASIQDDLQVTEIEYTVYSLPLVNATDVKIQEAISASVTGSPYNEVSVDYLSGSYFGDYAISQSYAAGTVVYDNGFSNRWFITTGSRNTSGSSVAADEAITPSTWVTWSQANGGGERLVGSAYYAYNIIVDAGVGQNNSAAQLYTAVQYYLKIDNNINSSDQTPARSGSTSDLLLRFVGDQLITSDGVYVDNFQVADTNLISFTDVSGTIRLFPFVATGVITFNDNLINDSSASFYMFFTSVDSGSYGSASAVLVQDADGNIISGTIAGSSSRGFTFDYDSNAQGGRTPATDAPVTIVAIGLSTAQFVNTTTTIERSTSNNVSLVSALERNYSNPA